MKKSILPLFAFTALLALSAAPARADVDLSNLPELDENEWWQKEGFGLFDLHYTQYKVKDLGKPMQGGGFSCGGEYVNQDTHFGIGGNLSCALVMQDYTHYKADDFIFGMDIYVPARISNELTFYAGVGGSLHAFSLDFDEEWGLNNGRSSSQIGSGERWKNDGAAATWNAFVGFRWRFAGHAYVFGEYRRESGEVDLVCENYRWSNGETLTDEIDLTGNRFLAGLGITF